MESWRGVTVVLSAGLDRKNKLCNLKIKPVMVLCAVCHGFQALQLRRFLFSEREGMKVVGWLLQAVSGHSRIR